MLNYSSKTVDNAPPAFNLYDGFQANRPREAKIFYVFSGQLPLFSVSSRERTRPREFY